jgi:hypothetical protein
MASRRERLLGVSEHHTGMPGDHVVTDLVRLIPAVFDQGYILIKQNSLLVRKVKGFETER